VSGVDFAIPLPVVPLWPIVGTCWLPWERWIPWSKLPLYLVGPYLLYCAFAAWHFGIHWWFVLIIAIVGTVVSGAATVKLVHAAKSTRQ
jgi:hypothetical protein